MSPMKLIVACPHCYDNTRVDEGDTACDNCGKPVPEDLIERQEPPKGRR